MQNSLCIQVLRYPILAALLHGTPAAAVSQTLLRGTRNGITEISQRALPIFGRAAITLDIGPYSSSEIVTSCLLYITCVISYDLELCIDKKHPKLQFYSRPSFNALRCSSMSSDSELVS